MIKNIVFDMGKVLVGYDGGIVVDHYLQDPDAQRLVYNTIFCSQEWLWLDMGILSEEEALKRMLSRLPEELQEAASSCFWEWDRYNMWTIKAMDPIIRRLKASGKRIYLCSNASVRLHQCYDFLLPAVDCFDGILFSAEEKCVKPQRQLYERFFARFGLKPEECFFIDDVPMNIEGARACGMDGYCFRDGDLKKLSALLESL